MIALDADQFAEIIKSIFPIYLILALPIFIILSPINPVEASHEFSAYRMQHFDLHGTARGTFQVYFNYRSCLHYFFKDKFINLFIIRLQLKLNSLVY